MTSFNGDQIIPRVTVIAGGKTLSWLFVKAATCMTATSFFPTFPDPKLKKIKETEYCVADSGDRMSSLKKRKDAILLQQFLERMEKAARRMGHSSQPRLYSSHSPSLQTSV
jgi:hypothetical protein